MEAKSTTWLHTILLALYFPLFLFAQNLGEARLPDTVLPLIFSLTLALGSYLLAYAYIKDKTKAAVSASAFIFCFFTYGRAVVFPPFFTNTPPEYVVFGAYAAFITFVTVSLKDSARDYEKMAKVLNVFAAALIFINCANMAAFYLTSPKNAAYIGQQTIDEEKQQTLPDIYYLIPDSYPRADNLLYVFKYDNSGFLNALRKRGFYIADRSLSNYASTHTSLSATLNMRYHDTDLADKTMSDAHARDILSDLIDNAEVVKILKGKGYVFVNFRSGGGVTDRMPSADEQLSYSKFRENNAFLVTFLQTSMVEPFLEKWFVANQRKNIIYVFDNLGSISKDPRPTFTLAHFVSPHPPFLFDRQGRLPAGGNKTNTELFIDQVVYTNKRILGIVDEILANSETEPIIIIQGDHGTGLKSFFSTCDEDEGPWSLTEPEIHERMKILNAMYLPKNGRRLLYPTITPVNNFRLILSKYLGEDMQLLKDKSYFNCWNTHITQFRQVNPDATEKGYENYTFSNPHLSPQSDAGMY